jgi:hypothetical protein
MILDKMGKILFEGNAEDYKTWYHVKQPKPPLGVTSKHVYEFQRVQELCRALYERSIFEAEIINYDLMFKWSQELTDRLNYLQANEPNKEIEDDESWNSL